MPLGLGKRQGVVPDNPLQKIRRGEGGGREGALQAM
jgi:hypothetical protein